MNFINGTPHEIRLQNKDGDVFTVKSNPDATADLTAETKEKEVKKDLVEEGLVFDRPEFIETVFVPTEKGKQLLRIYAAEARLSGETQIILVSIITLNAYREFARGLKGVIVAGMVPVAGLERVPPTEKIMRSDKFNL